MGTENARIRIEDRQVELKLTFEYADHMLNNYINKNPPHDVSFLEIQKIARNAAYEYLYQRIWRGRYAHNNKFYVVIIILTDKFAILKTCYYTHYACQDKK